MFENMTADESYRITVFIIVVILILVGFIYFTVFLTRLIIRKEIDKEIENLANNASTLSPEEFMEMRKFSINKHGKSYASTKNFAGVYILYNETKDMYYVGQGKKIFDRVNSHFTGKGNGDVYADWKYGDVFTIKMIALENSEFDTLNELERYTIAHYDSFAKGYNKTRGNRG